MYRYVERRFEPEELFGGLAASAFGGTGDLPPFLTAQLLFPYAAGEEFVARLLEVGGGGWKVVDAALRFRPPASTEQVMHPDAYLRVEQPRRVSLRGPVAALGTGLAAGAARELRRVADPEAARARRRGRRRGAAAGWGGDRYTLLGRGDERALVMRWTWDSPRDEAEFAAALRAWGGEGLPESTPAGRDAWRTPGRRRRAGASARRRHAGARAGAGARAPRGPGRLAFRRAGPVAQRSEQRAHNPTDGGSNPPRPIS